MARIFGKVFVKHNHRDCQAYYGKVWEIVILVITLLRLCALSILLDRGIGDRGVLEIGLCRRAIANLA